MRGRFVLWSPPFYTFCQGLMAAVQSPNQKPQMGRTALRASHARGVPFTPLVWVAYRLAWIRPSFSGVIQNEGGGLDQ